MKTEKIYVNNRGAGRDAVLDEMERFSDSLSITKKNKLHLRLLTEEMLGMVAELGGDFDAEFWAENDGNICRLSLEAEIEKMSIEKREALLDVSTTGENAAAVGFMGKLRNIFELCCLSYKNGEGYDAYLRSSASTYFPTSITSANPYYFNLELSKLDYITHDETPQWDELEKSIVANIADDISVGVKGDTVEFVITKKL